MDYKENQSNKKNTRKYSNENIRQYACWSCKRTDVPLRQVGLTPDRQSVYACSAHFR